MAQAMAATRRPSVLGYVLAGVLVLVGVAVGVALVVLGVVRYADRIEGFQRVPLGSTGTVELGTGGYSVYYEGPGASEASPGDVPWYLYGPGELRIGGYGSEVTYDISGYEGRGLSTVDVEVAGTFELDVSEAAPGGTLAIGRGVGRGLVRSIALGAAVVLGALLAALVLVVVTVVRRDRAGRAGPPPQ